jgi:hypothetical protein
VYIPTYPPPTTRMRVRSGDAAVLMAMVRA